VNRLALAGLPRVLAEPDADPCAVLLVGIEQQSLDVTRVGARAPCPPGLVICDMVHRKKTAVKLVIRLTYRSGFRISPTVLPPPAAPP
jgi:hypothetical protein